MHIAIAFVHGNVVETLTWIVGRPRFALVVAYVEILLKLLYEWRIGLGVKVAGNDKRLVAFLCNVLNYAYRSHKVGFGEREMGCCKYVVVKFSHEQRTCLLASGQRMLFGSYRTLAREDADAVLAAVETDGRSIRSIVAHVVGYLAKRVGVVGAAGHAVNLLYGNNVGADALQYVGYALVV